MKKDLAQATLRAGLRAEPVEYMLVLDLPGVLLETINSIKKRFSEKYGAIQGHTRAQITLVKFTQYEFMEPRMLPRISTIAGSLPVFTLELQGFGSLPTHTIYIQVLGKIPILHAIQALRKMQNLFKINEEMSPWFITEPSIIIARKLLPGQYEKAWQFFSHQNFSGRFRADNLSLLKRSAQNAAWKPVSIFSFEQATGAGIQEKLF
ncbi:MAG: 2'-5' RNA ligase family protein [Chitinophagaceae bacterium]